MLISPMGEIPFFRDFFDPRQVFSISAIMAYPPKVNRPILAKVRKRSSKRFICGPCRCLLPMMAAAAVVTLLMAAVKTFPVMMAAFMFFSVMMVAVVFFPVMMPMVVAPGVGIIFQRSLRKSFCGGICSTLDSGIKCDSRIRKRCLRSHADSSADQRIRFYCLQEARKGTVSASVGINDLLIYDLSAFDVIQLELLGVSEMLEDLPVVICDCYSHA